MMKGVYFGELHSYNDLDMILSSVVIEPPEVKSKKIDIPGADGSIDLTEFDGNIYYENREMLFTFATKESDKHWASIFSKVNNALHGKYMDIVLDDDSGFVWHGRVKVKQHTKDKKTGTIEIEVDAEPYKYNKFSSLEEVEWDSFNFEFGIMQCLKNILINNKKTEVIIYGNRKNVVPVIEAYGGITLSFNGVVPTKTKHTISIIHNGKTTVLEEGKNKLLDIVIKEGINILTFEGYGNVSIDFTGGSL